MSLRGCLCTEMPILGRPLGRVLDLDLNLDLDPSAQPQGPFTLVWSIVRRFLLSLSSFFLSFFRTLDFESYPSSRSRSQSRFGTNILCLMDQVTLVHANAPTSFISSGSFTKIDMSIYCIFSTTNGSWNSTSCSGFGS